MTFQPDDDPVEVPQGDRPIDPKHIAVWSAIGVGLLIFWAAVILVVLVVSNLLSQFPK